MSIALTGTGTLVLCSFFLLITLRSFGQKIRRDSLPGLYINGARPGKRNVIEQSAIGQSMGNARFSQLNSFGLGEVVRHFSGVQLIDYGGVGGLQTINVRSLGASQTAVFYNGIRMTDAASGQIDLSKFSLDGLESIELSSSPLNSLLHSAESFGNANSLYLESAQDIFRDSLKFHVKASLDAGSFGLWSPSLLLELKHFKKLITTLNTGEIASSGNYRYTVKNGQHDSTLYRRNAAIKSSRAELTVQEKFEDSSHLRLTAYYYNSRRGLPGAVILNNINSRQELTNRDAFIQGSFASGPARPLTFLLNLKASGTTTYYQDPNFLNLQGGLHERYNQKEYYLSGAAAYKLTQTISFSLAEDYKITSMTANDPGFQNPVRGTLLSAIAAEMHTKQTYFQGSLLQTHTNESVIQGPAANQVNVYSPSLMARFKPSQIKGLTVIAYYKNVLRLPTFNELYFFGSGNTRLKPESAQNITVSLEQQVHIRGLTAGFRAEAYQNLVTDKIITIPTNNLFIWSTFNQGKVKVHGLEGALSLNLDKGSARYTSTITLTVQHATDITPNSFTYGAQIPYTPVFTASGYLSASWTSFGANYTILYTGKRFSLRENIPLNLLSPWVVQDVSAWYQPRISTDGHLRYRLSAEINNLFAANYQVIRSFPMPGRSFRFKLTINY